MVTRGRNMTETRAALPLERAPRPSRDAPARPAAPVVPLRRPAEEGVVLTAEQQRRRRARSRAIAITLGLLALLFYVVTIVKLGPAVLIRPL